MLSCRNFIIGTKNPPRDPSAFLNVKSHAQKFTVIFDSRLKSLKAVSSATWKTGDVYENFQDAHAALQCEYKLLKG